MLDFDLRPVAGSGDRQAAERLWLLFCHDLSEFRGLLPNADGTFRSDRFWTAMDDPRWAVSIAWSGPHPVALVMVRGLDEPVRVVSGFFVVRGARRGGVGVAVMRRVLAAHPGRWTVAFQDDNPAAVGFWRALATEAALDGWSEDRLPVPDRPDLPPDVWITFATAPPEAV